MKIKITCRPRYNPWLKKYLNTKTFSKILAFGILLNSVPINSLAGILSDDGRYETFKGNSIKIDDVLEDGNINVEIEGNTLVNLVEGRHKKKLNNDSSDTQKIEINTKKDMFSSQKNYSFIVKGTHINYYGANILIKYKDGSLSTIFNGIMKDNHSNLFTVENKEIESINWYSWLANEDNAEYLLEDIIILEGNYLDKNINYFKGLKSVGQDDENGHNIEITSANSDNTQSNKIKISLSEPLRALPNEAKDRIIKKNGQWYIERNCGEILLKGNEQWTLHNKTKENTALFYSPFNAEHTSNDSFGATREIISDKFNYLDSHWERIPDDIEGAYTAFNGNICIAIKKSKLNTPDAVGFKEWLKNNPTRLVYKLSTPVYEPINFDSLQSYLYTTYISTNSTIPANLKVVVDRVANRAKEYSELAKTNPTIENISLARMWTNLMRESILKDEFQDSVDSITEIADMTLERKTASANLDVYVKSQNMLSMSLNTNSITFDGYSGVEDMEKLGAVNISINSSLPYSLNAYMPSEMTNSDKSEVLPIDTLNIRENSVGIYQTFNNTMDKVVLKDSCNAGNNKMHDIDLKLASNLAHKADVYKTVIKFEAEQK